MRVVEQDGRQYHVGGRRTPAILPVRGVMPLRRYLLAEALPTPPASVNYATAVPNVVGEMYLNDNLGDCVIACAGHVVGTETGNADGEADAVLFTNAQIQAMYGWCGYNGTPQSDQGCNIIPTFQAWQAHGAPIGNTANSPEGWVSVDPTNQTDMQTAIWLFGNLVLGVNLPNDIVQNMPNASGFTWSDTANPPDPNNGHCVPIVGYNAATGLYVILTWGMWGYVTAAWLAKYLVASAGGEMYTVAMQDSINVATQLAPSGFNWAQLQSDFLDMGGTIVPAPTPTPTPTPIPTPTPTPIPRGTVMVGGFTPGALAQIVAALEGSEAVNAVPGVWIENHHHYR